MRILLASFIAMALLLGAAGHAADKAWKQGEQYFLIKPALKMNPLNNLEVSVASSYVSLAFNPA